MKPIDWLLKGDPVIQYLTKKYLLNKKVNYQEKGLINQYFTLYDVKKRMWGGSIYSPKWISTHYTLMELKYMEVDPMNQIYQESVSNLLDHLWFNHGQVSKTRHQDMCVTAMVLGLACYGQIKDTKIDQMIDYILEHQFKDGGWNCAWERDKKTKKSSLHTTISVLEALFEYEKNDCDYRFHDISRAVPKAWQFILKKRLFRSVRTKEVINKDMMSFHYPMRWKYDAFRALEYFQAIKMPYDMRMQETIDLIVSQMEKGYITPGRQYTGKIHFKLEEGKESRFNTLRALKILKFYEPKIYQEIIESNFFYEGFDK
ncbi:MAG: hypothetical protein KKH01_01170 [Firmicutes bacterium]|nr:hypothetical protein [Bacillota bacterium]